MTGIYDKQVEDCLREMHLYMECSNFFEAKKDEFFNEFENKYSLLTSEQQELVKLEYMKMIEKRNKIIIKMKRRGMINYE